MRFLIGFAIALAGAIGMTAATIEGTITDPLGVPVPKAEVTLRTDAGALIAQQESDWEGRYRFTGLPSASYRVSVSAEGFLVERTELLTPSDATTRDVLLRLSGLSQQVVVTGARREEILMETPIPTTLIERSAIEDTAAQTLEQLLVEQAGAGVYVSRGFGIGFPAINGIGGNRVLVLVDGQRQIGTDNGTRDGIDLDQFTTERLERVEVVKGAASALYGSDAMGGVINLITRTPQKPFTLDLNNNYGSFGEANAGATLGLRRNRMGAVISGVYQTFDGFDLNPANAATTGFAGGENAFIDRNLSPSLFYDIRDNLKFRLNGNFYRRNSNFLNAQGAFTSENNQERWNTAPVLEWVVGARHLYTFRGDVSVARRFDLDRVENLGQFEALGNSALHPTNNLQYGFDWRRKQLRRPGLGSEDDITLPLGARGTRYIRVASLWTQDEWRLLGGRLTVSGGVRWEDNSQFGSNFSPKAGAVFRLAPAHRLRFAYGRGFRAPDVSELFLGFSPGAFGFVGNPELTPETSSNYSTGWTWAAPRVQASIDLFLNRFQNGIGFFQVDKANPFAPFLNTIIPLLGPTQQLFTNRNLGDFSAKGINTALTVSIVRGLEGTFNYTLLERLNQNGSRQIGLGNLRNSAFAKLGYARPLRLGGRVASFRTNVRGIIRGREAFATTTALNAPGDPSRVGQTQFIPAFATWDWLAGFTVPLSGEGASLEPFVSVNNLGGFIPRGQEYADGAVVSHSSSDPTLPVFREPGRTWKAGFILRFR
ncbi:MAG: TonB-dependent receptor [Bryobacterales bacterium]|nr:TonB-dependent receptor [Bryobacterales bacterium]